MATDQFVVRPASVRVSLILENVSLDIQPESTCAIVGKSGSGKSTLAKIFFNFYPTQGGSITLDGNNWAELDYDWLRSNMAMVPQDPELFADTIRFEPAGPRIPDVSRSFCSKIRNFYRRGTPIFTGYNFNNRLWP